MCIRDSLRHHIEFNLIHFRQLALEGCCDCILFVGFQSFTFLAVSYTHLQADLEKLVSIDEIGEKIAQSILAYFANESNRELVSKLKEAGLQLYRTEEDLKGYTDKLAGQSIVISGVFVHHSRDEYKELIEKNGGKNVRCV